MSGHSVRLHCGLELCAIAPSFSRSATAPLDPLSHKLLVLICFSTVRPYSTYGSLKGSQKIIRIATRPQDTRRKTNEKVDRKYQGGSRTSTVGHGRNWSVTRGENWSSGLTARKTYPEFSEVRIVYKISTVNCLSLSVICLRMSYM